MGLFSPLDAKIDPIPACHRYCFVLLAHCVLGSFADPPSAKKEFQCLRAIAKRRNPKPTRAKSCRCLPPRHSDRHQMPESPSANKTLMTVIKLVFRRGLFIYPRAMRLPALDATPSSPQMRRAAVQT